MEILWGVDADGLHISKAYADAVTIFQPAELFKTLGFLEFALRQLGHLAEYFTTIGIDAEVFQERIGGEPFVAFLASDIGDGAATEIECKATIIDNYLGRIWVLDSVDGFKWFPECTNLSFRYIKQLH